MQRGLAGVCDCSVGRTRATVTEEKAAALLVTAVLGGLVEDDEQPTVEVAYWE